MTDFFEFNPATFSFVSVPLVPVVGVATGRSHSCAVLGGGSVACWGSNASGQLGNGTLNDPALPSVAARVTGLPGPGDLGEGSTVAVTASNAHSCALLANGSVRCWGSTTAGQVTGRPTTTPQLTPAAPDLSPALSNVVAIAAGDFHTCALLVDGAVRCWGSNFAGRLGDGSVTDAVAIAAGGAHTCVMRVAGTAQCWGLNFSGQLGNNSTTSSTSPVTVVRVIAFLGNFRLTEIVAIEAGTNHTCAVRVDGQPFCWGENSSGQVGDGSAPTDQRVARAVPSFNFNIDPNVTLKHNGRMAEVTALANCPAGQRVQIRVLLVQGRVVGKKADLDHVGVPARASPSACARAGSSGMR